MWQIACSAAPRTGTHFWGGRLAKSKLTQNHYEEGHVVRWGAGGILETESNSIYRKYKEWTHGVLDESDQPIQSGHSFHMDSPYQQRGWQLTGKVSMS
jgi:hypothetical protein